LAASANSFFQKKNDNKLFSCFFAFGNSCRRELLKNLVYYSAKWGPVSKPLIQNTARETLTGQNILVRKRELPDRFSRRR
jgi:hypothetical protein